MADRGSALCDGIVGRSRRHGAHIDSRGKLTKPQVREKLRAEIEPERSGGVQYWALFDHRNGEFVGCGGLRPWLYTLGEANFEVGFHLVNCCCGTTLRKKERYWSVPRSRHSGGQSSSRDRERPG